jgi:hypothetical protein
MSLSIEIETNFPVFNNRSIIQADSIIKSTDFDIHSSDEELKPRKNEIE